MGVDCCAARDDLYLNKPSKHQSPDSSFDSQPDTSLHQVCLLDEDSHIET